MGQLTSPTHNDESLVREIEAFARETGQTMAEYAVMLGVITVGIVLALGTLSGAISNLINRATSLIPS